MGVWHLQRQDIPGVFGFVFTVTNSKQNGGSAVVRNVVLGVVRSVLSGAPIVRISFSFVVGVGTRVNSWLRRIRFIRVSVVGLIRLSGGVIWIIAGGGRVLPTDQVRSGDYCRGQFRSGVMVS